MWLLERAHAAAAMERTRTRAQACTHAQTRVLRTTGAAEIHADLDCLDYGDTQVGGRRIRTLGVALRPIVGIRRGPRAFKHPPLTTVVVDSMWHLPTTVSSVAFPLKRLRARALVLRNGDFGIKAARQPWNLCRTYAPHYHASPSRYGAQTHGHGRRVSGTAGFYQIKYTNSLFISLRFKVLL